MRAANLRQWRVEATATGDNGTRYGRSFVNQKSFAQNAPKSFAALAAGLTEYR